MKTKKKLIIISCGKNEIQRLVTMSYRNRHEDWESKKLSRKNKKGKRKLQTKWNGKELKIDMVRINTTNNNMFAVIFRILGIEEFERKSLPFWFQKPHSLTCLLITLLPVLFFLCPCSFVINWLLFRFTVYRVNVGISSFRVWHKPIKRQYWCFPRS